MCDPGRGTACGDQIWEALSAHAGIIVRREREHAGLRRAGGGDHTRPGARQHRVRRRLRGSGGATQVFDIGAPSRHVISLSVPAAALRFVRLPKALYTQALVMLALECAQDAQPTAKRGKRDLSMDQTVVREFSSMSAMFDERRLLHAGKLRRGSGTLRPRRPGRRRCERRSTRSAQQRQTLRQHGVRPRRSSPDCGCALAAASRGTAYRWHHLHKGCGHHAN